MGIKQEFLEGSLIPCQFSKRIVVSCPLETPSSIDFFVGGARGGRLSPPVEWTSDPIREKLVRYC